MRNLGVSVKVLVALSRNELAPAWIGYAAVCILNQIRMHSFMRDIEEKWFRVLLFQEIQRVLVQNVREVAALGFAPAVHVELRVEIAALALDAHPMVDSRSRIVVDAHVPFAEEGGLVTGVVQQAQERD